MENVTGKLCRVMSTMVSNQDKQEIHLGDSVQKPPVNLIFTVVDLLKVEYSKNPLVRT